MRRISYMAAESVGMQRRVFPEVRGAMGHHVTAASGGQPAGSMAMNQLGKVKVLVAQSCLTLCDPMGCSPPGSSVHGILQARILE